MRVTFIQLNNDYLGRGTEKRRGLGAAHHSVCRGEHVVRIGVRLIVGSCWRDVGVKIPQLDPHLSPGDAARTRRTRPLVYQVDDDRENGSWARGSGDTARTSLGGRQDIIFVTVHHNN